MPALFPRPYFELLEAASQPCLATCSHSRVLLVPLQTVMEFAMKVTRVCVLRFCVGPVLTAVAPSCLHSAPRTPCFGHSCPGVRSMPSRFSSFGASCGASLFSGVCFFLLLSRSPCFISCRALLFPRKNYNTDNSQNCSAFLKSLYNSYVFS